MEIKLFGIAKEIIGDNCLSVRQTENLATVGDVKQWLARQYPALQNLQGWAIAVDREYAADTKPVTAASEIALLPPVSGG